METTADAFNVPHFTTTDPRSPSAGGWNGLGCVESHGIQSVAPRNTTVCTVIYYVRPDQATSDSLRT